MRDLSIDFEELELEAWDDPEESYSLVHNEELGMKTDPQKNLKRTFKESSSQILRSGSNVIVNGLPLLDYFAFVSYISTSEIEIIPESELRRVSRLGSGATMTVFGGTCPSRWGDTVIALKRLNLEIPRTKSALAPNSEELYHQIAAMSLELRVLTSQALRYHPNIVKLLGVSWEELGEDKSQTHPFKSIRPILVVELACPQYPTLDEYYKYSSRRDSFIAIDIKVSILSDVADALAAVHVCGVIHGDIKPQNVLIFRKGPNEPLIAKLSDFGGCQPPLKYNDGDGDKVKDGGARITSAYEFAILGTQYWNPPEVLNANEERASLYSRRRTRDYYSLGLLAYYILFEEMLFGDDQDDSEENLERIAKIKNDPMEVQKVARQRMGSTWGKIGTPQAFKELLRSENKLETFRRLYADKQIEESFRWANHSRATSGKECRHYPFYFIIRQLVQYNPEDRLLGNLVWNCRKFLEDSATSRTLKEIYLINHTGWENLQTLLRTGMDLFEIGEKTQDYDKFKNLVWRDIPLNINNEMATSIDEMPPSLRAAVIQELYVRAEDVNDKRRISALLSLEYCNSQGYISNDGGMYALKAARLGSILGIQIVLHTYKQAGSYPPIKAQEHCKWVLNRLFTKGPSQDKFKQQIFEAFLDLEFLEKILSKEYETKIYLEKHVKGLKLDGDPRVNGLFSLVISGKVAQVKSHLNGIGAGELDIKLNGFSLLHAASQCENSEMIRMLIQDFGMDANILNDDGVPPIVLAARADNTKGLKILLNLGTEYKRLLCARTLRKIANYGSRATFYLLYKIATIWAPLAPKDTFSTKAFLDGYFTMYPDEEPEDDEPEFPPIFAAILGDNIAAVWDLLKMGCSRDIYAEFSNGFLAPIHLAASLRPLFLAVLLYHGANPNLRTRDGVQSTALHIVCVVHAIPRYNYSGIETESKLSPDIELGFQPPDYLEARLFMVELLVKVHGADVNAQDWYGRTAIFQCLCGEDGLTLAQHLIDECNANILIKDFREATCLHGAILNGARLEHVEFCVRHGINVNDKDLSGFTPLILAATFSRVEVCQILLDLGADFLATDNRQWTCLHLAIRDDRKDIAEYLFEIAEKRQFLLTLASMEDQYRKSILHQIIYMGADCSSRYLSRFTKVSIADVLEKLDSAHFTLLHHAVFAKNLFAAKFLLQMGANVNAKGWKNLSPLHIAYVTEDMAMIETLAKAENTDLRCSDEDGRTPEALGKLCASDPKFWPNILELCNSETKGHDDSPDTHAIEIENRIKAAPKDGWFVV